MAREYRFEQRDEDSHAHARLFAHDDFVRDIAALAQQQQVILHGALGPVQALREIADGEAEIAESPAAAIDQLHEFGGAPARPIGQRGIVLDARRHFGDIGARAAAFVICESRRADRGPVKCSARRAAALVIKRLV